MDRRELLIAATSAAIGSAVPAFGTSQPPSSGRPPDSPVPGSAEERARWLALAETLKPALTETEQLPVALVRPVPDASLPLRFRMETEAPAEEEEEERVAEREAGAVARGTVLGRAPQAVFTTKHASGRLRIMTSCGRRTQVPSTTIAATSGYPARDGGAWPGTCIHCGFGTAHR